MRKWKLNVAGITDIGTTKQINEDSFMYKVVDAQDYYAGIFAVADGVGGLNNGEIASAAAISGINKWWEDTFRQRYHDREALINTLKNRLEAINQEILTLSGQYGVKMATTLTVFLVHKNQGIIAHIGDSRIYRISRGVFHPRCEVLTEDHSRVVDLMIQGQTVRRSVLTECLGYRETINPYYAVHPINPGEIYVICSDGIYKTMEAGEMEGTISHHHDTQPLCETLISMAKDRGETDNITVIAVKIEA